MIVKAVAITLLLFVALPTARSGVPLGLDVYRPIPETNPLTPEKIALGRRLFFDRRLSRDGTIACANCHDPQRAFTDGRRVAVGIDGRAGELNVPTLINRVYGKAHFLDGRAGSLERQALDPVLNPIEMDLTLVELVRRLGSDPDYATGFRSVFGRGPSPEDFASAIASYERSILAGDAPFDRYMDGDADALSEKERRGLRVFRGKANCTACHVGPTFTDESFHNTGIAWRDGALRDEGRFAASKVPSDHGAFKTSTLREIARTPPYMHDGSIATLEDVIDFYNAGGRSNPHIDPEVRPLRLSVEEQQALVAFLKSLSGSIREGQP